MSGAYVLEPLPQVLVVLASAGHKGAADDMLCLRKSLEKCKKVVVDTPEAVYYGQAALWEQLCPDPVYGA